MSLSIAVRLRPYSHLPGIYAPIPLSNLQCQCFPTLLQISTIDKTAGTEVHIAHGGPTTQFTVALDLESPSLLIWQHTPKGLQKFRLYVHHEKGLMLAVVRGSVHLTRADGTTYALLQPKEEALLAPKESFQSVKEVPFERLSLGSHKAQEVLPFSEKRDLFSLLPMWMRLGALIPCTAPLLNSGTACLLSKMYVDKNAEQAGEQYEKVLHTILRTGFYDLFVPRLVDRDHQGDEFPAPLAQEDPWILLTEGSKRLRECFLHTQGNQLHILPGLSPSFHAGRFLNASCGELGLLSIEWTKRCIRQMHFTAHQTGTMTLQLPAKIRKFRLRYGGSNKRIICSADKELSFCLGQNLFFDRFEH